MNLKIIVGFLLVGLLTSCTWVDSGGSNPDYVAYPADTIRYPVNYDTAYGPDANETDFNHDSAVGYGGVNVYNYQGI